jgi:predicted MFS family arabinose efflux permease
VELLDPPLNPQLPPEVAPLRARQARRIDTFRALQHRNFRLYLFGQLVSLAGTWMQIVAQGWLVYELSGSEAMLGLVGFASAIPALLVTPWAGVVVDQVRKRDVIVATQTSAMLLAFVLAALTFTGAVEVWHIIIMSMLLGVINAFDGPARQSFVVEMVGSQDLPNAIALNSMTFNAARVVGPAFGGILLATVGSAWCFTLNGLSFLAVIVSLLMMQITSARATSDRRSPWQQLKSGLHYVAGQPELKGLLLLSLSFSTFGIAYSTVLPSFVDRILSGGAAGFGMLTAASGIGAVTGAFLVATFGDRGRRGSVALCSGDELSRCAGALCPQPQLPHFAGAGRVVGRWLHAPVHADQHTAPDARRQRHARACDEPLHADLLWLYAIWEPGAGRALRSHWDAVGDLTFRCVDVGHSVDHLPSDARVAADGLNLSLLLVQIRVSSSSSHRLRPNKKPIGQCRWVSCCH